VSKRTTATHGTSFYSCLGEGQLNKGFEDSESFYSLTLPDKLDSLRTVNGTIPPPRTPLSPLISKSEHPKSYPTHIQSLLLLVFSTIFFATASILLEFFFTQNISKNLSLSWLLLLLRSILQLIVGTPFLLLFKLNPFGPSGQRRTLFVVFILSFSLSITINVASTYIHSSTGFLSSMIIISLPLTLLMSFIFAKESLGIYRILTTVLFLIGVTLIVRPSFLINFVPYTSIHHFNVFQFNPLGIAVLAAQPTIVPESLTSSHSGMISASLVPFLFSIFIILTHRCRSRGVSVTVLLVWTGFGTMLASIVGLGTLNSQIDSLKDLQQTLDISSQVNSTSYLSNPEHFDFYSIITELSSWSWSDWLVVVFTLILSTSATIFTTLAAAKVEPGRTVLIRSVQILLTFALQSALFPTMYKPAWQDLCGAVVMAIAVIFVGIEEMIVDKKRWRWF